MYASFGNSTPASLKRKRKLQCSQMSAVCQKETLKKRDSHSVSRSALISGTHSLWMRLGMCPRSSASATRSKRQLLPSVASVALEHRLIQLPATCNHRFLTPVLWRSSHPRVLLPGPSRRSRSGKLGCMHDAAGSRRQQKSKYQD